MMPVQLRPMTAAEFIPYRAYSTREYAREKVDAGNWDAESALDLADQEYTRYLPDGVATADNFLYIIEDTATGSRVGVLWVALTGAGKAFIYDFEIDESVRRHGYATLALYELEQIARDKGVQSIGLHVFAHNHTARALYQKVGYVETNINMSKTITPPAEPA
jgi:ribosomal protein S18 acetylase RimI-like enzyme